MIKKYLVVKVDNEKDYYVYSCDSCPMNIEYPNPLWKRLPAAHYCKVCFDCNHKEGRPIFIPNIIPDWCPYADE